MPQNPEHLHVTMYDGTSGALCQAWRHPNNEVRRVWWIYELKNPDAATVHCPDCAELLSSLRNPQ